MNNRAGAEIISAPAIPNSTFISILLDIRLMKAYDNRVSTFVIKEMRNMKINSIGNSYGIYNLYSAMFQNSMSLNSNKLYKDLFPSSKTDDKKQLEQSALQYVKNIKSASKNLNASISNLSGAAFKAPAEGEESKSISAVEDFVKNYNDLYSEAIQKQDDPKAQSLATKLLNISKTYSGSLSNIGIGFDGDGRMTINKETMNKAAENGKLETFFTQNKGKNYGFTNQLSNLANNNSRNTSNYVSSSVLGNSLMENFSYSSAGKTNQYNFLNSGWLFDYLF